MSLSDLPFERSRKRRDALLLKLWDKAGGKYSFEWLLAKLLNLHRQGSVSQAV
jgi:ribulose kinase